MAKAQNQIGRYLLLDRIGVGGMGEVYNAVVVGPNKFTKELAVKKLSREVLENPLALNDFVNEARIGSQLLHPNIAQIFDFQNEEGEFLIVMELIRGRDLSQIQRRLLESGAKFPGDFWIYVIAKVAEALDYAHNFKQSDGTNFPVIHRDISPQNIMVSFDGYVKLLDFGIAKLKALSRNTKTGTIKGKCRYFAPEQLEGKDCTPGTDVFSLGIVLYECLAGRPAYDQESDAAILGAALKAEIPDLATLKPDIDADLNLIVMKALAKDVDVRYRSADEFAHSLQSWLKNSGSMREKQISQLLGSLFEADLVALNEKSSSQRRLIAGNLENGDLVQTMQGTIESDSPSSNYSSSFRDPVRWLVGCAIILLVLAGIGFILKSESEQSRKLAAVPADSSNTLKLTRTVGSFASNLDISWKDGEGKEGVSQTCRLNSAQKNCEVSIAGKQPLLIKLRAYQKYPQDLPSKISREDCQSWAKESVYSEEDFSCSFELAHITGELRVKLLPK